jgi:hypothetical protein
VPGNAQFHTARCSRGQGLDEITSRAREWKMRGADVELLDAEQTRKAVGSAAYTGALRDRRGDHSTAGLCARPCPRGERARRAVFHPQRRDRLRRPRARVESDDGDRQRDRAPRHRRQRCLCAERVDAIAQRTGLSALFQPCHAALVGHHAASDPAQSGRGVGYPLGAVLLSLRHVRAAGVRQRRRVAGAGRHDPSRLEQARDAPSLSPACRGRL